MNPGSALNVPGDRAMAKSLIRQMQKPGIEIGINKHQ